MEIWSLVPWLRVDRKQMHHPLDLDAPWLSIDICFRFAKFENLQICFLHKLLIKIGWDFLVQEISCRIFHKTVMINYDVIDTISIMSGQRSKS